MASSPVRKSTNGFEQETRRPSGLFAVHFARFVGVQDFERLLQARRVQQKLQVLLAAVGQEVDDFLIAGARLHDLVLACVDIDQ